MGKVCKMPAAGTATGILNEFCSISVNDVTVHTLRKQQLNDPLRKAASAARMAWLLFQTLPNSLAGIGQAILPTSMVRLGIGLSLV